jgi:hypothetical protein
MKFGALLLATFIFFLSVKSAVEPIPALAEVDACCKGKAEHQGENGQEQPTENSNCDELCNPFQPCCPYLSFSSIKVVISLPRVHHLVKNEYAAFRVSFPSHYFADFWQPPKLV